MGSEMCIRDSPGNVVSAKCLFSICLGIRKSAEHNFDSEKIIREKQRAPPRPRLGSRALGGSKCADMAYSSTICENISSWKCGMRRTPRTKCCFAVALEALPGIYNTTHVYLVRFPGHSSDNGGNDVDSDIYCTALLIYYRLSAPTI